MFKVRYVSVLVIIVAAAIGFFVWNTTGSGERFDFKLGLDLSGGSHLEYSADTSRIPDGEVEDSLAALQAVIERRVNAFGVGEPVVQTQRGGVLGAGEYRLIVELPGVTDLGEAIRRIGETPTLEFKLVKLGSEQTLTLEGGEPNGAAFEDTGLTGAYLSGAQLQFGNGSQTVSQPVVAVRFNAEGTERFADLTTQYVGRNLAIFLDGRILSAPVIQERITGGTAVISGNFTPEEAKALATNLNLGALPVPIALSATQTIGATLGDEAVRAGIAAGIIGFILLAFFLVLWYRLPGLIAVVALILYIVFMLALFKLIPVVLTAAGIAAFLLSVGLAVDANILIAERIKEELETGKTGAEAIRTGFSRAWSAIRDSNITNLIAAIILFWLGTSVIKGFALVFGLGVLVSMLSAIVISRSFLLALGIDTDKKRGAFLMKSGLRS